MRQRLPSHKERPPRIGLKHRIPLLQAHLIQRSRLKHRSIIHHHIQPAKLANHCANSAAHGVFSPHVAPYRQRPAAKRLDLLKRLRCICARFQISNRNIRTRARQRQRNRPPNASRTAGNQCRFAPEEFVCHHEWKGNKPR